jgi:hypothetical protein
MSTSMSLDTTTDVKVTKVTEQQETKDETMSLDAPTVTTTDFSEYSDEVALIPKEFLTPVDGRESYEEKYKFGAPELKDFTINSYDEICRDRGYHRCHYFHTTFSSNRICLDCGTLTM